MDVDSIIAKVSDLLLSGGIIYMAVEHLLNRRKYKASIEHQKGENKAQNVETAGKVIDVYQEVQEIIDKRLAPILAECQELRNELAVTKANLAITQGKLEDLESNWVCFRSTCDSRDPERPGKKSFRIFKKSKAENYEI